MKYPDDFKAFEGKHLCNWEIDELVQDALESAKDAEPNEFSDFLASVSTGDTRVEVREYGVIIWQQIADY